MRTDETEDEIDEISKWEEKNNWKDLKYKSNDFQQFETTRSFSYSIYTGKINIDEAEMDQTIGDIS